MEALAALAAQAAPQAGLVPQIPQMVPMPEQPVKRGPGRPPKRQKDYVGSNEFKSDKPSKRKHSDAGLKDDGPIKTGMKQDRNMRPRTQRWRAVNATTPMRAAASKSGDTTSS